MLEKLGELKPETDKQQREKMCKRDKKSVIQFNLDRKKKRLHTNDIWIF